jgi:flagellar assembly protein FliH
MSTRVKLAGASILPFQYPSLKEDFAASQEAADPDPPDLPFGEDAAPEYADEIASPDDADEIAVLADDVAEAVESIAAELERAREEGLRRGLEEGREEGYAAGFAEGAEAGEAKAAQQLERLSAIIDKLGAPLSTLEQRVEEAVAALALEVARCVIGDGVKRSRDFLVRMVREAIAKVPLEMGAPRILLSPDDLDLIRHLVPEIEAGSAVLVADDTIEPGGALIVADGEERQIKDRRWNPRIADGASQVNLTLSSRWRTVMLTLFDGEEEG